MKNDINVSINPLQPGVAFLYPLKTSENLLSFLMFSERIEKQHRAVMGQSFCPLVSYSSPKDSR